MQSPSGSVLLGANVQVPFAAHVWHAPVQAPLQQTPSAQNPLTHSFALLG